MRFEWRRSFDSAIDVSIGKRGDTISLLVTRHAQDGTLTRRERRLVANDWSKLERIVANAHLENVRPRTIVDCMAGVDGADWTIYVDRGAVHQSAVQWAPAASDSTRIVGEAMLDLAGRDVVDGPIY